MVFQDGQGCPWFRAATSLPANLQPKNVQGCTFLGEDVRGATQKRRFVLCTNLVVRTPKDGRGISQKQVLEQNLSSTDVHGRTSVERYTNVHFWTGYFKRLTENVFSKAVAVCASTSCCTKRIGTGFSLYHRSSTFHSLMVRFSSSNPAPMSTIFFPSALCCSA